MESDPDILIKPYFEGDLDDGETVMHLLAKEGCIETLRKILDVDEHPKIDETKLVESLLKYDNAGWSPLMSALKADRNAEAVVELFLKFLEQYADTKHVNEMTKENPKVNKRKVSLK